TWTKRAKISCATVTLPGKFCRYFYFYLYLYLYFLRCSNAVLEVEQSLQGRGHYLSFYLLANHRLKGRHRTHTQPDMPSLSARTPPCHPLHSGKSSDVLLWLYIVTIKVADSDRRLQSRDSLLLSSYRRFRSALMG